MPYYKMIYNRKLIEYTHLEKKQTCALLSCDLNKSFHDRYRYFIDPRVKGYDLLYIVIVNISSCGYRGRLISEAFTSVNKIYIRCTENVTFL